MKALISNFRARSGLCVVFLLYLGLAVRAYWPALGTLDSELIGYANRDAVVNAWGYWWTCSMLVEHLCWPAWTNLLNYPDGQVILTIDSWNCLLSIPLQVLLGFPTGYNVFLLFATALSGLGGFLLARELTGSEPAALVAGALYGWAPFALSNALIGNSEVLSVGWVPLFFLFLYRSLTRGSRRNGILAGAFLTCTTTANWYFGFMASLFAVPVILVGLRRNGESPREARIQSLKWMLLIFAASTFFMFMIYHDITDQALQIQAHGANMAESVNLGEFLKPRPIDRWHPKIYYLPPLALLLVGLGVLAAPRRAVLPLTLGLVALLLALGHRPQSVSWGPPWVQPPLSALSGLASGLTDLCSNIPLFRLIRSPWRWMVLVNLAAALIAAMGLARMLRLLPRAAALMAGLCLAIALTEGSLESMKMHQGFETIPIPDDAWVRVLEEDPTPGAVIQVPYHRNFDNVPRQLLAQTQHRRPILQRLHLMTTHICESSDAHPNKIPTLVLLEKEHRKSSDLMQVDADRMVRELQALDMRFLVLHRNQVHPVYLEFFESQIASRLELMVNDGSIAVFKVPDRPGQVTPEEG